MTDDDLVGDVTDKLFWDPAVDNAGIAVSADAGFVTLRGTVGSFRQKREAKRAAELVFGVRKVANEAWSPSTKQSPHGVGAARTRRDFSAACRAP